MNIKQHPLFIPIALASIIALGIALVLITKFIAPNFSGGDEDPKLTITERTEGDPLDVVEPFYRDWLKAALSTSTDPYVSGLDTDSRLSDSVKNYLAEAKANTDNTMDPVLCQQTIPPRVGSRTVFVVEDKAQIMMIPRGVGRVPEMALVDLVPVNGQWQISNIACVSGETAPEREFSFEKTGNLLKGQAPLDPQYWYAIYEEDGQFGYTAPLFFSEASLCIKSDGTEGICNPNSFVNPSNATIKGEMTESGVDVKRIEF